MITFREYINQVKKESEKINESVDTEQLNSSGIGYLVSKTLAVAAQVHVWHLLAKSGQKHSALGAFYYALETEVDGLAEKFIAIGGVIPTTDFSLKAQYDDAEIIIAIRDYREYISSVIGFVKDTSDLQSILDGLTDLQEKVDQFIYKFKLD